MIDKVMIRQKITLIQRDLSELKEFRQLSFDQIASDYRTHKAVERIIESASPSPKEQ